MVSQRGTLAVIPARGGSKRLPRKNILEFFGKPMIAWTIEAALQSQVFDRVLVSTEDAEIAAVARAAGAEVPFLRHECYDDHSPVSSVTVNVLSQCRAELQEEYETVVQLMANCPLRDAEDIHSALGQFRARGAAFQISCFRYGWSNAWWAVQLDGSGRGERKFPQAWQQRSQDLPALYCPTGAIWVAQTKALSAAGTFYGPEHRFHAMSWISALDIDDAEDLVFARAAFLVKQQEFSQSGAAVGQHGGGMGFGAPNSAVPGGPC